MNALRRYLAAIATLGLAAFEVETAWHAHLTEVKLLSLGFALALFGLALGLLGRRHWARLITMGGGIAGGTQMAMFAYAAGGLSALWWPFWAFAGLCAVVVASLSGRSMAREFRARLAPESFWHQEGMQARVLAGVVVACAAAVPMLLIYAQLASKWLGWTQVTVAVAGAVGLAAAGGLVLFERTAGLLMLVPFASMAGFVMVHAGSWLFGRAGYALIGYDAVMTSLLPSLALGVALPALTLALFAKPLARFWRAH